MFRKLRIILFLSLTFFLIFTSITSAPFTYGGDNSIITVPDDAPSINAAVAMASKGGIVKVKRGIYAEAIYINKSITLLGENSPTILEPLTVAHTENVTIKGIRFIIDPPGTGSAIIVFNTSKLTLENLNIRASYIFLINSTSTSIKNCNFTGNPGPSIRIQGKATKNITIEWCHFNQTYMALIVRQATGIIFRYNTVNTTQSSIKLLGGCQNATIHLNNFLKSEAEDYGLNNKWYNETLKLGNYWADISITKDKDGDGIIDEYKKLGGTAMSEDKYPLAKPFTEYLKNQNQPANNTVDYMIAAIAAATAIITTTAIIIKRRREIEQK